MTTSVPSQVPLMLKVLLPAHGDRSVVLQLVAQRAGARSAAGAIADALARSPIFWRACLQRKSPQLMKRCENRWGGLIWRHLESSLWRTKNKRCSTVLQIGQSPLLGAPWCSMVLHEPSP